MSEANQGSGTSPSQQSGAPAADGGNSSGSNGSNRDPGLQDALKDLHKYKSQNKNLTDQVQALTKDLETLKSQKLQEKEDWKTAFEEERKKTAKLESDNKSFFNTVVADKKREAVRAEALKAGILNEKDVDFLLQEHAEDVTVEGTTEGRLIVHGAELVVEAQKKVRPYLFKSMQPPNLNPGGGQGAGPNPPTVTAADVVAAKNKFGENSKEFKEATAKWLASKKQT